MNVFCSELKILLQVILLIARSVAIPIDNGVDGDPEIECGASSIAVNLSTRKIFEGHVYVKNNCRSDEGGRQVAGIVVSFESCGLIRTRSLNPRGVFVLLTIVVSFHILEGGPYGIPVQYSTIGQQVYHKWTCTSETVNTFCMVVHSCSVDDGNGDRVDILDSNGCALDRYVLNDLEYPEDLLAGQEAHVYKYADRDSLYYQCQISLQVKENGECVRPICVDFFNSPPFKVFHKNRQAYDRVLARLRDPEINRNTTTSFSQHVSNYSQGGKERSYIEGRVADSRLVRLRRSSRNNFDPSLTVDVRAELTALDITNETTFGTDSICFGEQMFLTAVYFIIFIFLCFIVMTLSLTFRSYRAQSKTEHLKQLIPKL